MTPIGSPETSISNQPTSRNNPEDGRIHFNRGESLRLRTIKESSKDSSSVPLQASHIAFRTAWNVLAMHDTLLARRTWDPVKYQLSYDKNYTKWPHSARHPTSRHWLFRFTNSITIC
jgi:hypothetical protein